MTCELKWKGALPVPQRRAAEREGANAAIEEIFRLPSFPPSYNFISLVSATLETVYSKQRDSIMHSAVVIAHPGRISGDAVRHEPAIEARPPWQRHVQKTYCEHRVGLSSSTESYFLMWAWL
jgi:hypothetical protein